MLVRQVEEGSSGSRRRRKGRRGAVNGAILAATNAHLPEVVLPELSPPYLIFLGDTSSRVHAKTGLGIVHWRRERCLAQYRFSPAAVDLGLPDLPPVAAAAAGARSMVVGSANIGGFFPETWLGALVEAAGAGLDIVAGMHTRLAELPGLADAARAAGTRLIDVRVPPKGLPVATGRKRRGRRLLTVGTDCAVGKKYTALALEQEMRVRGMDVTFRATGQTGIMIAGAGIPIDAVVADFVAGAAEVLSPDNRPEHWDVVEGQGAIFHPAYAGVTLSLVHGTQPDAIVLCHQAGLAVHDGWPDFPIPPLAGCIEPYLQAARLTNPAVRFLGISVNTSSLAADRRRTFLRELEEEMGLPCVDPVELGVGPLVDVIQAGYGAQSAGGPAPAMGTPAQEV